MEGVAEGGRKLQFLKLSAGKERLSRSADERKARAKGIELAKERARQMSGELAVGKLARLVGRPKAGQEASRERLAQRRRRRRVGGSEEASARRVSAVVAPLEL